MLFLLLTTSYKKKMNKLGKLLFDKVYRTNALLYRGVKCRWLSDEELTKRRWKHIFGVDIDLENPRKFNEKIQWLKLNYKNPLYVKWVDKYEAKLLVEQKIGKEYVVPNYSVWNNVEDINIDDLPEQFVLKCTHDSGGLAIVKDKKDIDINSIKVKINKSFKRNFYWNSREWQYRRVSPRIIAEKYLENTVRDEGLRDYKFFCFNGEPKFLYISEGLDNHETARICFVTLDWKFAKFQRSDFKCFEKLPPKPSKFDEMIEVSKKLSSGFPFVRVDLYQIDEQIYFSELTFTPCGGFMTFENPDDDYYVGEMLDLSQLKL